MIHGRLISFILLLKLTGQKWLDDNGPRLGAALAFYSALSIGPLLILLVQLGEFFWAKDVLTGRLTEQMTNLIGADGTEMISAIVQHSQAKESGWLATILSLGVLFVGASGVFTELQSALNIIWHVPPPSKKPFLHVIRDRSFSFVMILGTGFLLLVSLVVTMGLSVITQYFGKFIPDFLYISLLLDWVVSIGINTLLFASIFRWLPEVEIHYKDVWMGAFITAVLFDIGKVLISIYLSYTAVRSTYGAAGSFLVFLLWVYYSAQILYFGAKYTSIQKTSEKLLPA